MQALRKVTVSAAEVAQRSRHLHVVRMPEHDVEVDTTVVSLAAVRARRAGHPAGADLTS